MMGQTAPEHAGCVLFRVAQLLEAMKDENKALPAGGK
jgi:hypothetical protein